MSVEDQALVKKMLRQIDTLERLNDAVGDRNIRHEVSKRLVEARLLIRDGNLDNLNGGNRHGRS